MSWPQLRQTRVLPSGRSRELTLVGLPQGLPTIMTLETWIGPSFSMMPAWVPMARGRMCRLIMFTPCTTSRFSRGKTCLTCPCFPRSLPAMTSTRSSRLTFLILDHLRRQGDDLHELALAQLAGHGPKDAGAAGVLLVGEEHRGVLVEADVRAIATPIG